MAKLIIPTPLRKFTDNQASVETHGATVLDSVKQLTEKYPELKQHVLDQNGRIRSFVRIYVGDNDIKSLDNENTKVQQDTVISIIPAIAGGVGNNGQGVISNETIEPFNHSHIQSLNKDE